MFSIKQSCLYIFLSVLFSSLIIWGGTPAQAQNLADLKNYDQVQPGEPTAIDGVWKLNELGKQVLIDGGHVIALDEWDHLLVWRVTKGMVTSTELTHVGDGRFTAYDALLKRQMDWILQPDGTIKANGGNGFFAPRFSLSPIELTYTQAYQGELAKINSGAAVDDKIARAPAIDVDPDMTSVFHAVENKCLELRASDAAKQGGRIQTSSCNSKSNQKFIFLSGDGLIVTQSGMCLEAAANRNGAAVKSFGCDGNKMQIWTKITAKKPVIAGIGNLLRKLDFVQFRHKNGRCLDVHGPEAKIDGATVQIWDCNPAKNQIWAIE